MEPAEIVIKSNAVFTGDGSETFKGGVAVSGQRIVAVGTDEKIAAYIGEGTEVREYGDRLLMPGFNDSHAHFTYGAFLEDPDFCVGVWDTDSFEECMAKVKAFADSHPDNEWVFAPHVLQFKWEKPEMPTAAEIDAYISDRPVVLQQVDFHTLSANTMAMQKAGITRDTPDPIDGTILKDEQGEPTGVFSNGATFMFTNDIYSPSDEVAYRCYNNFFDTCKRLGLTAVANLFPEGVGYDNVYDVLRKMEVEQGLPIHVLAFTGLMDAYQSGDINKYVTDRYTYPEESLIEWRGLKAIVDGVCSAHTAWMLDEYSNAPGNVGEPAMDPQELRRAMVAAQEAGKAVRVHAIGDRGIHFVLDSFEEAEAIHGKKDLRHCIEHDETVCDCDVPRYRELGVSPAMQPMHMVLDLGDKAKDDAVGPERAKRSWRLRDLLDAGANVTLGTDFPIVEIDPLHEVYGAVTRQLFDGTPEEGWFPEQRISLAEALRAYTLNSAIAEGVEDQFGMLKEGLSADLIVLDRNLFAVDPKEILEAKVVLTMLRGGVVYEDAE